MFQTAPILLGQYRPHDSFLHRLDARAKLLIVLLVMVVSLLTHSAVFYIVLMAILLIGLLFSGVTGRVLVRSFRPIVLLVAITFIYHIIFTDRDSEPLFDLFGFAITSGGLDHASFFSLRLLLFIAVAFLVTLTSSPSDLAEAVTKLLRPLEKIRIPVGDLGLILFIAIRFIPILTEEFTTIRNAQVIRGVDFSGNLFQRARKTTAIIIPVLIGAIGRADELAMAIEARGYRGGQRRTFYSRSHFDARAWLFVLSGTIVIVALFMVTR